MQYFINFLEDIIIFIPPYLLPMLPTAYFFDAEGYGAAYAIGIGMITEQKKLQRVCFAAFFIS